MNFQSILEMTVKSYETLIKNSKECLFYKQQCLELQGLASLKELGELR